MSPLLAGSAERAEYGCTVTFENEHGKTWTIHRQGPPTTGLRQACAIALARDETFRIVSYSTPETIYRDLAGREIQGKNATPAVPELYIVSQAGLRHMLHPRLTIASDGRLSERKLRYRQAERKARG